MFRITAFIASLLAVCGLFAQTPEEAVRLLENEEGSGVRAMAMGNAFSAVADDYTAVYWNPAGLALLSCSELGGDFTHFQFSNEATFWGNTQAGKETYTKLKSLGLAYRFPTSRGGFGLGLGFQRIKDLDGFLNFNGFNEIPSDLSFELEDDFGDTRLYNFDRHVFQTEEIAEKGHLNIWSIGAGIAMSPHLNLGAAIQIFTGKYDYLFDFYQDDVDNWYAAYPANFLIYELHQRIFSQFSGAGLKIGGLFHVNEEFRLGLSVDLPTAIRVHEDWSENDALIFDDDFISEMNTGLNEWEYAIRYPAQISLGAAFDFKQILLAGNMSYRDWTQTRFEVPDGYDMNDDYSSLLSQNFAFSEQFRPVWSWGVGGEYRTLGGVSLRGGYRVVPSPLYGADETLDKRYFSAGLGLDLDKTSSIHVTYVKGIWNRSTVDDLTPGGTEEKLRTDRVVAGITLKLK
jgi:long-subunit fatty acid transport protein